MLALSRSSSPEKIFLYTAAITQTQRLTSAIRAGTADVLSSLVWFAALVFRVQGSLRPGAGRPPSSPYRWLTDMSGHVRRGHFGQTQLLRLLPLLLSGLLEASLGPAAGVTSPSRWACAHLPLEPRPRPLPPRARASRDCAVLSNYVAIVLPDPSLRMRCAQAASTECVLGLAWAG